MPRYLEVSGVFNRQGLNQSSQAVDAIVWHILHLVGMVVVEVVALAPHELSLPRVGVLQGYRLEVAELVVNISCSLIGNYTAGKLYHLV